MAKSNKPYTGKIPFADGNLVTYTDSFTAQAWYRGKKIFITWKDNYIFSDIMVIDRCHRYSSSIGFFLKDSVGYEYYISLTTMFDIIKNNIIVNGTIPILPWTFRKIGTTYLMVPA